MKIRIFLLPMKICKMCYVIQQVLWEVVCFYQLTDWTYFTCYLLWLIIILSIRSKAVYLYMIKVFKTCERRNRNKMKTRLQSRNIVCQSERSLFYIRQKQVNKGVRIWKACTFYMFFFFTDSFAIRTITLNCSVNIFLYWY